MVDIEKKWESGCQNPVLGHHPSENAAATFPEQLKPLTAATAWEKAINYPNLWDIGCPTLWYPAGPTLHLDPY